MTDALDLCDNREKLSHSISTDSDFENEHFDPVPDNEPLSSKLTSKSRRISGKMVRKILMRNQTLELTIGSREVHSALHIPERNKDVTLTTNMFCYPSSFPVLVNHVPEMFHYVNNKSGFACTTVCSNED